MITIIHGDDTVASRNYLFELKQSIKNTVSINKDDLNFIKLLQIFGKSELFDNRKDIFIEEFLSSRKNISDSEKIITLIKNSKDIDIYLWEKDELTKPNLTVFPNATIKLFKISQTIFNFLDNIKPNSKENIINFHKTLETSDAEAIFYMLIRQFRILIAIATNSDSIDEIKRLAPWQKDKLTRQSKYFSIEKLKKIYNKLFEIDLGIKSGTITKLSRAVDFIFLEI